MVTGWPVAKDGLAFWRIDRHGLLSDDIAVEIFNRGLWDMPGDDVLQLMCRRYLEHV